MGTYGTATDGEYAVSLSYTFPHRFWTVAGTETNRVVVEPEDTLHLMCTVWDPVTDTVLPVDMSLELLRDGELVTSATLWAMLSQRMGFHYGENVSLPGEGAYTARIRVGPLDARPTGELEGRFESASTLEIDFEYQRSDIHELEFELIDHDRRGTRDALELMDHGDHHGSHDGHDSHDSHDGHDNGDDGYDHGHSDHGSHDGHNDQGDHQGQGSHRGGSLGHPPASRGAAVDDLQGTILGSARSADAYVTVLETDLERFVSSGDETYLAVFTRTPYNDVILPLTSLTVRLERGGDGTETTAVETLDHEFGHHYGVTLERLESGDRLTISIEAPPQIARHDGYETAFFEFDEIEIGV
ncbi:hypothetical protein GCM10025298_27150 [Natronobiforma cellulositropha]